MSQSEGRRDLSHLLLVDRRELVYLPPTFRGEHPHPRHVAFTHLDQHVHLGANRGGVSVFGVLPLVRVEDDDERDVVLPCEPGQWA